MPIQSSWEIRTRFVTILRLERPTVGMILHIFTGGVLKLLENCVCFVRSPNRPFHHSRNYCQNRNGRYAVMPEGRGSISEATGYCTVEYVIRFNEQWTNHMSQVSATSQSFISLSPRSSWDLDCGLLARNLWCRRGPSTSRTRDSDHKLWRSHQTQKIQSRSDTR